MTNNNPTASDLLSALQSGQTSSVEVVTAAFKRIQEREPQVQAFLGLDEAGALETAKEIDARRQAGKPVGRLAGIPVAVKDNMCVKGWNVSCASRMLENFVSPYDAHAIERLKAEDAVLIGRTNMDEFAMGSSCENSAYQKTTNPWNPDYIPGGSSGGSAAAVGAGMAPLALGSDTGGSIRQPAAFCGVVGLKPTYGRISRYGLIAFASSLDQIGPFGQTVSDVALLLDAMTGHDPRDSTSVNKPATTTLQELEQPLEGLKIGVVPELNDGLHPDVDSAVEKAIEVYKSLGAVTKEISLPHARYGVAAYYVIAPSEASSNLARFDGVHYGYRSKNYSNLVEMYEASRGEGFGAEVKRRIMIGAYALSAGYYDAYYLKALKIRRLIAEDLNNAFQDVDVILTPTTPTPPFRTGEHAANLLQMYLNDMFTITANLAGLPGISVPCGQSQEGLPIGMQLLGPAFEESRLLRAARMYERETRVS